MNKIPGLRFILLILAAGNCPAFGGPRYPKPISNRPLSIRIYDLADVSSPTLAHAIQDASEILSTAGVHAIWQHGSDADEAHTVDFSTPTVKQPAQDYRGYIVVGILNGMPSWFHAGALGYTLPDAQSGVNATIFYDRIKRLDESGVIDLATVLGRVIAHEVGHVLLGSTEHCDRGIMRAICRKEDFQVPRRGTAEFTAQQRTAIRNRIAIEVVQARK